MHLQGRSRREDAAKANVAVSDALAREVYDGIVKATNIRVGTKEGPTVVE